MWRQRCREGASRRARAQVRVNARRRRRRRVDRSSITGLGRRGAHDE